MEERKKKKRRENENERDEMMTGLDLNESKWMMSTPTTASSNEAAALPKPFVHVLRTLFDILDDKRIGLVSFTEIEARWQEDGAKDLPRGVVENLRKVTPANGMLSFDRFCAGLKICLLRNQMDSKAADDDNSARISSDHQREKRLLRRPPSAPILEANVTLSSQDGHTPKDGKDVAVGRTSMATETTKAATSRRGEWEGAQRTSSMPHLPPHTESSSTLKSSNTVCNSIVGPPKPPRINFIAPPSTGVYSGGRGWSEEGMTKPMEKWEIRAALQNWRVSLMVNDDNQQSSTNSSASNNASSSRAVADGTEAVRKQQEKKRVATVSSTGYGRRREPRRHTLQNGVDANLLKKMRQMELEKEILLDGLHAVEVAREWYRRQLSALQDRINYFTAIGPAAYHEQWNETQQERVELLRARVLEVNRHLATLGGSRVLKSANQTAFSSVYKGNTCNWPSSPPTNASTYNDLPMHMNLAVPNHRYYSNSNANHIVYQLSRQNLLLTQELNSRRSAPVKDFDKDGSSSEATEKNGSAAPPPPPLPPPPQHIVSSHLSSVATPAIPNAAYI